MPKNTPYSELKEAILILEKEQALRSQLLKEQFKTAYESLKPLNFIKNTISSFTESTEVKNGLYDILIALAAGFISKKALAGNQRQSPLKQAGILLITGLNSYISRNPEIIRTIAHYVVDFFHKKEPSDKEKENE